MMTATYSPDDNKLRLYSLHRLDAETFARVKAAGFRWAPKQDLFVAPMWTPEREDLLIELCGEIGDEDTSLLDRAEERAERFETYSEKREADADRAHEAVARIADNIPLGQPILVGHHSERHARKDAERIENGMRKAVRMWETSKYWTSRAAGAIEHAKYKELPAVRARRIKTIEADKRRQERTRAEYEQTLRVWNVEGLTLEMGRRIANALGSFTVARGGDGQRWTAYDVLEPDEIRFSACPSMTIEEVQDAARKAFPPWIAHCDRWIAHFENRLAYERAMLGEAGGTVADRVKPEVGGGAMCWASPRGGFSYIVKVNRVSITVLDNWGNGGKNFTRTVPFDKLPRIVTAAEVTAARSAGTLVESSDQTGFFLRAAGNETSRPPASDAAFVAKNEQFDAIKDAVKHGVTVVSAPQLFPTPAPIVARMLEEAAIESGMRVLEPSAGTGSIADAIAAAHPDAYLVCNEINAHLVSALDAKGHRCTRGDFLTFDAPPFDRIIMNPPFAGGADIRHIEHALRLLQPGGRLVALCAAGPRQQEKLGAIVEELGGTWEDLPAGSFSEQGTNVRVALLVVDAPKAEKRTPLAEPIPLSLF